MWFRRNGNTESPALVLSGGGAMGALQVGILRVLARRGFRPSRIVGTSVGALNGAFFAFYPDEAGVDRLAEIWRELENGRFIHFNAVSMAYRLAARRRYLFNNDFLRQLILDHAIEDDFSATEVPLHITATDLTAGRKHVFSRGAVSEAVLASTAIPGVFSPIEIDGHSYIDGGVLANLDLDTAVETGAKEILAIDLSHCFDRRTPNNVLGVITRTVDIVMREHVARDLARLADCARISLIQPEIPDGTGLGELRDISRLIDRGEEFGEAVVGQCFDGNGRLQAGVHSTPLPISA